MNARIQIVRPFTSTAIVAPWGFDMEVSYEYTPAEEAIYYPTESAHPGSPANAELDSCKVAGVDITDMLTDSQREHIEEVVLSRIEE